MGFAEAGVFRICEGIGLRPFKIRWQSGTTANQEKNCNDHKYDGNAAGMNGRANAPKLEQRRRVGFGEFSFDTPQLAAGRFIFLAVIICPMRQC
jgi:hypothetical protein